MPSDVKTSRTFVLIPGAGGQAWYWHLIVPLLEAAGHEAIAVQLPAGDDTAGIEEYVDVVVQAIGERRDVIVVGQSMGGFTAAGVCARVPVAQLVFVNAMVPAPGETAGEWWTNTGQGEAKRINDISQGRDPDAEFDMNETFFHDVPADVTAEAFAAEEPQQSDTPFGSPSLLDGWPEVPTKVIIGRDDRLFPVDFQRRVAQDRLAITPDVLSGGHLIALAHPDELAARLLAYASEL
jgi:pimeloyl-ACP methyl ester carboxylesterase